MEEACIVLGGSVQTKSKSPWRRGRILRLTLRSLSERTLTSNWNLTYYIKKELLVLFMQWRAHRLWKSKIPAALKVLSRPRRASRTGQNHAAVPSRPRVSDGPASSMMGKKSAVHQERANIMRQCHLVLLSAMRQPAA